MSKSAEDNPTPFCAIDACVMSEARGWTGFNRVSACTTSLEVVSMTLVSVSRATLPHPRLDRREILSLCGLCSLSERGYESELENAFGKPDQGSLMGVCVMFNGNIGSALSFRR